MENNNIENNVTNQKQQISTPTAIIVAGFLIMVGILLTKNGGIDNKSKTLSEQVGVSKTAMAECIEKTDLDALKESINKSVSNAIARENQGTPYSVVIGPNGFMTDIRGALPYDDVKLIVDSAKEGKLAQVDSKNLTEIYNRNIALSEPTDHMKGSSNPVVTIIEYSDFECPFCKQFHPTMERIVKEDNSVKWVYRNFPLGIHQHAFEKAVAANCVAEIKGDEAFWKYSDLLFGLLKTADDSVSDQL